MHHVHGDHVPLKISDNRHYGVQPKEAAPGDFMEKFTGALKDAVKDTNQLQVASDQISSQMMLRPDSVDVHDVMIAAQKAQMSLDFTRQVLTKAVQAYQNITNLR